MRITSKRLALPALFSAAALVLLAGARAVHAQSGSPVYEIRTYTANEGRLEDMHETFRRYWTKTIFPKHGMTSVIYLAPTDTPLARNTMVYILRHPSREAAERSWATFGADPEVKAIAAERNANGRIVAKVERVYASATDFSPIPVASHPASDLTVLGCNRAETEGATEIAAVCRVNARWDEANLKMDPEIVEPILDERFLWPTEKRLVPKADVVGILRDTDVRFGIYESEDVTVYSRARLSVLQLHPVGSDVQVPDSLLGSVFEWRTQSWSTGTVEALIASGDLRQIADPELRSLLADWPARVEEVAEDQLLARDFVYAVAIPELARQADVAHLVDPWRKPLSGLTSVRASAEAKAVVAARAAQAELATRSLRVFRDEVDAVLIQLQRHLDRL